MINFVAKEPDTGKRLDVFISTNMPSISRSFLSKLCDKNLVSVNGSPQKSKKMIKTGDKVCIDFDFTAINSIPSIKLDIIYEDDDCAVISKPEGVLTHSKGAFNPEATIASFMQDKYPNLDGDRSGIVHRLDRATSGVIICAKNNLALAWLQKQFAQRKVKKTYYAIVSGHLSPKEAIIDMPIQRHPRNPKLFRVSAGGRSATTQYSVLESSKKHDLLQLLPRTGRTHQLRVHLKKLGHPIVGDLMYDGEKSDRLYLHAADLEITLPSKDRKVFAVTIPKAFNVLLENDG